MHKTTADFRAEARAALRGKWGISILVTLVAGLLGAGSSAGSSGTASSNATRYTDQYGHMMAEYAPIIITIFIVAFILAILFSILSGAVSLGQNSYYINLIRGDKPEFVTLFKHFNILFKAWGLLLYMSLLTLLWSLLFVIPGIIAAYRYAMAPYIMAQNPDIGIVEAVERSKEMMAGNKAHLFCLELTFIGWAILCVLTLGIGTLWLGPYMQASMAAFYLEVSGQSVPTIAAEEYGQQSA